MFDSIVDGYNTFVESGDERVKEWMFVKSPMPSLAMIGSYLLFVKIIGPKWMQNRPAFDLRNVMIVYNFIMVAVSGLMFYEMADLIQWGRYIFKCQKVDYSTDEIPMRMCNIGWLFLVTKYIEFIDTVFFVLRKKQSHVSKLHVIHHSAVPLSVWVGLKFAPGGNNAIFPPLNSFVHTVMYLYYGLAAFGPSMQKYLWWKKYLTSLQLCQFVLVMIHGIVNYMRDCDFPRVFIFLNSSNAVLFFVLFSSFYRQRYGKRNNTNAVSESKPNEPKGASIFAKLGQLIRTVIRKDWEKCCQIIPVIKSAFKWDKRTFYMYISSPVYYGRRSDNFEENNTSFVSKVFDEEDCRKVD